MKIIKYFSVTLLTLIFYSCGIDSWKEYQLQHPDTEYNERIIHGDSIIDFYVSFSVLDLFDEISIGVKPVLKNDTTFQLDSINCKLTARIGNKNIADGIFFKRYSTASYIKQPDGHFQSDTMLHFNSIKDFPIEYKQFNDKSRTSYYGLNYTTNHNDSLYKSAKSFNADFEITYFIGQQLQRKHFQIEIKSEKHWHVWSVLIKEC